MTNILIVTDNIVLYKKIESLFLTKGRKDIFIECRHSPSKSSIWKHHDLIEEIDVNKKIDWIIANFHLVISVHCLQFFPKELVDAVRCVNIHPGYNPINRGWYPQVFSIIHDLPIGATIHEMDEKLDHGPIIARQLVDKYDWDTSLSIYNRVLETEILLLDLYFDSIIDNTYTKIRPEAHSNMYRKSDFAALCEIDMNQSGSFREFYDLLRALSHGEYKNAFFMTEQGEKVFIKMEIEKEV
jgi:dTDP-4-amino-4,6-dideoxyglucose formyltransferase